MIQAFYKSNPQPGVPYLSLSLMHHREEGWRVRLVSGILEDLTTKEQKEDVPVASFDEGMPEFDRIYKEVTDQGWRPYSPFHPFA